MSPKVLWDVVRAVAARAHIDKLAPHDLRRTIWDASRSYGAPSTIGSGSSPIL